MWIKLKFDLQNFGQPVKNPNPASREEPGLELSLTVSADKLYSVFY